MNKKKEDLLRLPPEGISDDDPKMMDFLDALIEKLEEERQLGKGRKN